MNDLASADANIQTAMLEVISEGISGALLVYDKNDLIVFASQQLLTLLPVPRSHLAAGTRLRDFLGALYDGGGRLSLETNGTRRIVNREGWVAEQIATLWKERSETVEHVADERWISFARRRLPSGYGICIVKDVTELRRREEQWRADMERVQVTEDVLDNLPFPIMVKDRNLARVAVNKAACRFHDLPAEVLLGTNGSDIHSPVLEERLDAINRKVLEDGEEVKLPERLTRADGSEMVIVAHKYRIGKPGRYYLVTAMQQISDLVEFDAEGRAFVPMVGDPDLYSAVLRRDDFGQQEIGQKPVDIAGAQVLVVSADTRFCDDALRILTALRLEGSVVRNPMELSLCLDIAVQAKVRVDLIVTDHEMEGACLDIAAVHSKSLVSIDPSMIEERFASVVTRELTRSLGGISPEDDWQIMPDDGEAETIDIIVAEDNEVNQIVFSQILESFGYRYAIAVDGEEAVQLWQEHRPRLVLMDLTLPRKNGFEAARAIRAIETADDLPVPIIGVMAQAFDRDREECFASGMNDVILKPISPEALDAVFGKFLVADADRDQWNNRA
ncbi:response regulator [Neorhizobium alkalisoli]|jgi:PAS domain S-box-containing protein|uniref:PAS domain S-box-containing protein n=1 Tax=Neorhizobium alkalisoli TaxID=528178 RepID=A0A561R3V2_9HYPH|nr:response regulator [Neorhizobium alkalisoli]TWF57305.1 PAS domain S-box-containing protein [Neorhizobium alkalisoli]